MSISNIRGFLTTFFNPQIASNLLREELKNHRLKIKELNKNYNDLSKWNDQYTSTLSLLTDAIDALIWKKDKNHKYILANSLHCKEFFGLDITYNCLNYIVGKSDKELIHLNFHDKNIKNTFGDICKSSDQFMANNSETTHFLEAGRIGDKDVLMYVIKTPQFSSNLNFVGSIGMAWNMTHRSEFLLTQLNRWIYSKKALCVFREAEKFCYAIVPEVKKCKIFKHICMER